MNTIGGRLRGDSGSMPIAVLLTIIGLGMSVVLATVGATQLRTTRNDLPRGAAVNAAQTGLDVALGQLRAATASAGSNVGSLAMLPCAHTTGLTGAVSAGAAATYTVKISYLAEQPSSMDPAWVAARRMPCNPGAGLATLPQYAFLESTGRAGPGLPPRTLLATYAFTTVMRARVATGGLIPNMNHATAVDVCLAAPRADPGSGDDLIVARCDGTSDAQKFLYEPSLNLVLAASRRPGRTPMCLDAPPTAGVPVEFQPCTATPVPRQRWGQNDYSAFEGTTDGVQLNKLCFNVVSPGSPGSAVRLGNGATNPNLCFNNWSNTKTFFPGPDVGAGRAGRSTNQLVNYAQSSRCVDVTADDVDYGFLVVFPCKQLLTGRVLWNQEFMTPAVPAGASSGVGRIWTTAADGYTYCLTSPGSTAPGAYVLVRRCPAGAGTPANMTWTYRLDTGFPSTSYRIESTYGVAPGGVSFCLTPTGSADYWDEEWAEVANISKLVLARCDGSNQQKWSVSSVFHQGALTNIVEP